MNSKPYQDSDNESSREDSIVNSALWAAAGDALGWITELSHGRQNVKRRSGEEVVTEPVSWERLIGGRNGPKVELPAGTYSDDTQLRLAVSRSIRGSGKFDVETFAKIELPVWPTYALGGGLGTKAAAVSLSRRGSNWFSNFYDNKEQSYIKGGGNGAAMRIQPHVWASNGNVEELVLNVLKDALVTHGHPQGFCGAIFHALCLNYAQEHKKIPSPDNWVQFLNHIAELPHLIDTEPQLHAFWLGAWESNSGITLRDALDEFIEQAYREIDSILGFVDDFGLGTYHEILIRLGCTSPESRGAGFKTALAALALSYMYRNEKIEEALVCCVNILESDTDTIATMAGALLGVVAKNPPNWAIQDREYIISEALRLASIPLKKKVDSFDYPDLGIWNPPSNQAASVGLHDGNLAIVGLGVLTPISKEYPAGDAIWQWCRLPFGQTILAKRKAKSLEPIPKSQLPRGPNTTSPRIEKKRPSEQPEQHQYSFLSNDSPENPVEEQQTLSLDLATDRIIESKFDDATLGRIMNHLIDSTQSIESAVALAAIVAKAKLARRRRQR